MLAESEIAFAFISQVRLIPPETPKEVRGSLCREWAVTDMPSIASLLIATITATTWLITLLDKFELQCYHENESASLLVLLMMEKMI